MSRMAIGALGALAIALVAAPAAWAKEDMTIWGYGVRQPIYRGETTQLKYVVKNNGPATATGVWVQADVPTGLHVLGTKLYGGGSCSVQGSFVKCQLGDFVDQQMGTLLIDVRGDTVGTWITEGDVYSTDGKDTSDGNGQVRATIMVKPRASSGGGSSPGASAPAPSPAARMRARFDKLQRVVQTGGIRVTMRVPRDGALLVGGRIRVPGGFIDLSEVSRQHATSRRAWPIWLGTTPGEHARLTRLLRGGRTLPAEVWVRYQGETIRYALRVRR